MTIRKLITYTCCFALFCAGGCKKYLDEPTDSSLVLITSLQDLQALLENHNSVSYKDAGGGEASADNYYLRDADYAARTEQERNMYTWAPSNIFNNGFTDWSYGYDNIYRANTILDNIDQISKASATTADFDNVRGQAYFLRGKSLFQMAVEFAPSYNDATADTDLGVPIRLSSDINEKITRADARATYAQVLKDLKASAPMLPVIPAHVLRASRTAAYGMIARVYLSMRIYDSCAKYADLALQLKSTLVDFSSLPLAASFPFAPEFSNPEIIFHTRMLMPAILTTNRAKIDSTLYRSYASNDLRKRAFFSGSGPYAFKGSYAGTSVAFAGVATNELYLMRAECYARANQKDKALKDLNDLLRKRFDPTSFVELNAANKEEALSIILAERRKELIFSGLRWMDIKRLNKEGAGIRLTRVIAGKTHTLEANDPRFALAIPENVIALSGIAQNPR